MWVLVPPPPLPTMVIPTKVIYLVILTHKINKQLVIKLSFTSVVLTGPAREILSVSGKAYLAILLVIGGRGILMIFFSN